METYTFLRQFADSWMLLALFIFFIGTWFWAFRPGSRPMHDDAANSIFRHEDAPADDGGALSQDNNTDPEGQK
ncbi:cbb3-type cytochrome c oxidase subunit 3 [Salibaculum griseiflavum]|jgi:cytochrome c oxidase cbb3-type subunit 4|uniref:CcoQ/FixQ family Cbb3-type cytochrome c oxidase assembly chaperone n=1 Tax=Salibaculum griseiflavum TaxID=1914409 RepID=A0A2V1P7D1_9RHOB|nr:cbb3-type cytochrome c oxidase subunit 3 [Salibaculum griseiflavum]PWG18421.1 CcoQ/FixQ family Cbb3-type cytochrome c oxidase assembly chaperone [Salibaculum griseiflavum]